MPDVDTTLIAVTVPLQRFSPGRAVNGRGRAGGAAVAGTYRGLYRRRPSEVLLSAPPERTAEQRSHGDSAALWPGYWLHFTAEWFVSVLADTYGALLLVVLTKWFYEEGSAESQGSEGKQAANGGG